MSCKLHRSIQGTWQNKHLGVSSVLDGWRPLDLKERHVFVYFLKQDTENGEGTLLHVGGL